MPLNLRNTRSDSGYMADPGYKPGVLTPRPTNCTTTPVWISQQDQKLASLSQMVPSGPLLNGLVHVAPNPPGCPPLGCLLILFTSEFLLLKHEYLVSMHAKDWFHHILNPYTSGLTVTPGSGCYCAWCWSPLAAHPEHPAAGSLGSRLCSWVQPTRSAYFKGPLTWRVYLCLKRKVKMMPSLDRNTERWHFDKTPFKTSHKMFRDFTPNFV